MGAPCQGAGQHPKRKGFWRLHQGCRWAQVSTRLWEHQPASRHSVVHGQRMDGGEVGDPHWGPGGSRKEEPWTSLAGSCFPETAYALGPSADPQETETSEVGVPRKEQSRRLCQLSGVPRDAGVGDPRDCVVRKGRMGVCVRVCGGRWAGTPNRASLCEHV